MSAASAAPSPAFVVSSVGESLDFDRGVFEIEGSMVACGLAPPESLAAIGASNVAPSAYDVLGEPLMKGLPVSGERCAAHPAAAQTSHARTQARTP